MRVYLPRLQAMAWEAEISCPIPMEDCHVRTPIGSFAGAKLPRASTIQIETLSLPARG